MTTPITLPVYQGDYAVDSMVFLFWSSFGASSESITQSGLAVTDIEIYKNGVITARSSDSGYTLLDTDGTDLDGATGVHGVSIDLNDDSDAGFFARGNDYFVIINAVTINSQTVRFCAGTFSIENRASVNGVGDYAVTIKIRTTGGSPVSGVSVWVNTSNTRSGSVAGTKVTDSNGEVVFNLEYTTHYVFCHLSGYTFASASFTSASGSVDFTKDIGTALSSGASSDYVDSFLSRAIVDVREAVDEPTVAAKYTDARIIEHLEKAYILVLNEKNRNDQTMAVGKITKTIASGVTAYVLPHTVGSVYGIYKVGESGGKVFYDSRSRNNQWGRGMWIEGNILYIQTTDMYGLGTEITIEYVPSGVARLHNGTCTLNADGTIATLGATPNAGVLDTHHEGYTGSIFRILKLDGTVVTGNYLQERTIEAHDEVTREITLNAPLSPVPTTDNGNIYYEIAPEISKGMDTVVALYAAYRLCITEGNRKRAKGILEAYRNEMRNVKLTAYYTYMPKAPLVPSDSYDNRRYRGR
jgi:hypothetical protein